jgi:hypothetical protein
LAKSRVHIGDASAQIQSTHACDHGVFHRTPKIGFRHERFLGLNPPAGVTPVTDQHPGGHQAQHTDQPKKPTAHQALRGAPGLCTQDQIVAHRRNRHFVIVVGFVAAGQQTPKRDAPRYGLARQQMPFAILQSHRIFGQHLGGDAITQQPLHAVFGQDHATEAPLVVAQRGVQLQHSRLSVPVSIGIDLAINGLHQISGQTEVALCFTDFEHRARAQSLTWRNAGDALVGNDAPALINPGQ